MSRLIQDLERPPLRADFKGELSRHTSTVPIFYADLIVEDEKEVTLVGVLPDNTKVYFIASVEAPRNSLRARTLRRRLTALEDRLEILEDL